jgi:hypothetical protein
MTHQSTMIRQVRATILLLVTLAVAAPAGAQEGNAAAPQLVSPLRPEGGTQWSVFYGFGVNQEINRSAPDIDLTTAGLRWAHMWSEHFGGLLRGHPAVALEVLPLMAFLTEDGTTWGGGANLIYEHHFAVQGRVLPVWQLGAGFLYTNRAVPVRETRHNFSLLTALGVDIMVTDRSAVFLGYRFHHVSNANTGNVNPGINVHSIVVGASFYR